MGIERPIKGMSAIIWEKSTMSDLDHITEAELQKMPGWKRRSILRAKRRIARLLKRDPNAKLVATQPQPESEGQPQRRRRKGCGGCRAARKAFNAAKQAKDMALTEAQLEKIKSDLDYQISLTVTKIYEHRNYKGPCPECVKRTLDTLEISIVDLHKKKSEIEARIASFTKAK